MVLVKRLGLVVFCIDEKGVRTHMRSGLQTSINSQAQEDRAETASGTFHAPRKAAHAKTGHRITRQFLSFGELLCADVRRAQGVETQNFAGLNVIDQHKYRANAFGALLHSVSAQILVKYRLSALEADPAMPPGIKGLLFKHA